MPNSDAMKRYDLPSDTICLIVAISSMESLSDGSFKCSFSVAYPILTNCKNAPIFSIADTITLSLS